jgi:glycogen operon protein
LVFFAEDHLDEPSFSFRFDPLHNKSGPIWHCRIPVSALNDARYYSYRIAGPTNQSGFEMHAFDREKLLLDPYARSVFFPPEFTRTAAQRPGSNVGRAPLALLDECQCPFAWNDVQRVRHEADLIVYEMHVRGFTQNPNSGVPSDRRGTFLGVIDRIPYLVDLGVTAIELMPVFQFDPQEGNFWGYMPLSFFAPHHAYSTQPNACAQRSEFRQMVQALHAAGIEVILDVVFNHTCEGDENGPTYSFKGIDNSTYYMISPAPQSGYANFSGCGNTLHTANRAVRQLIVDSLRYWATEMHVDGFRFDLASVFTRNSDGSINLEDPPIFAQIADDPALAGVRLIAEPWDAGDGFLLGNCFPGTLWMQWNAQYRDTLQRFVRGDGGLVGELMTRLYGSSDLFPDDRFHAFRPFQSVNYIASHDGFTLYDLVSYNRRHNQANGHDNTDGPNEYSWNCGVEGDVGVPAEITQLRKQQVKNLFCLLMLSNGTPMFRMGDEFLQTQRGNNNPYKEDSETTWLDWSRLEPHADVFRFVKNMIAFRKAHPSLSRSRFWRDDVQWYGPTGPLDFGPRSRALAFFLDGNHERDANLYVMVNGDDQPATFDIQPNAAVGWKLVIDTGATSPRDIRMSDNVGRDCLKRLELKPRSIAVLIST